MHLKIDAYSVIILPSGDTNLWSHKIFKHPRPTVPKVEMTAEAVFVLSKFDIHFVCLTPFWRGKGTKWTPCPFMKTWRSRAALQSLSFSPVISTLAVAGWSNRWWHLCHLCKITKLPVPPRDRFSGPWHFSHASSKSGESPAWLQHCQGLGATQQKAWSPAQRSAGPEMLSCEWDLYSFHQNVAKSRWKAASLNTWFLPKQCLLTFTQH